MLVPAEGLNMEKKRVQIVVQIFLIEQFSLAKPEKITFQILLTNKRITIKPNIFTLSNPYLNLT